MNHKSDSYPNALHMIYNPAAGLGPAQTTNRIADVSFSSSQSSSQSYSKSSSFPPLTFSPHTGYLLYAKTHIPESSPIIDYLFQESTTPEVLLLRILLSLPCVPWVTRGSGSPRSPGILYLSLHLSITPSTTLSKVPSIPLSSSPRCLPSAGLF
jgi:hypothetical protein